MNVWMALQLFVLPVVNAYAVQVKANVVVSITYADVMPATVCVNAYGPDDLDMALRPRDAHCFKPTNTIGDFDTWTNERLDMTNFKVVLTYATRATVELPLVWRANT